MIGDWCLVIVEMILMELVVAIEKRKHDTRRGTELLNPIQIVDDTRDKQQKDSQISLLARDILINEIA